MLFYLSYFAFEIYLICQYLANRVDILNHLPPLREASATKKNNIFDSNQNSKISSTVQLAAAAGTILSLCRIRILLLQGLNPSWIFKHSGFIPGSLQNTYGQLSHKSGSVQASVGKDFKPGNTSFLFLSVIFK